MDIVGLGFQLGIPIALIASLFLVAYLDPGSDGVMAKLRSRLLLGLPLGTLTTVLLVLGVYLFLQQAFWHPSHPLTIPFTSWSYLYPLGMLTGPFAHQGVGHLTGNLLGFLTFGAVAEYAFSHFPTGRGSHAFGGLKTNPFVRAFLVVPAAAFGVGLTTSLFSWGPIIGFSGVVFAAAGFALIRYPMVTVVALVGREFVGTLYYTLRDPIVTGSAGPSFGPPWWAGIAIQGHLLGFLTGVVLAVLVLAARRDTERPTGLRLWIGTTLAGSSLTLWAVWWYHGTSSYILYRGPGILMVAVLGVLVAAAVKSTDKELLGGVSRRQVAMVALTLPLLTMGFVAVPVNLTTLSDTQVPGDPIEVEGYQITYAEDVPNQRIVAINVSLIGESTQVNSSGVIVINSQRRVWDEAVSAGRLGHAGEATITLGGIGWRKTVEARRTGWQVSGGGTTYLVSLQSGDQQFEPVYHSDDTQAAPVIAGRNISLSPRDGRFEIQVVGPETDADCEDMGCARAWLPDQNESVEIGGIRFERNDSVVYATRNRTRVPIFQKETHH